LLRPPLVVVKEVEVEVVEEVKVVGTQQHRESTFTQQMNASSLGTIKKYRSHGCEKKQHHIIYRLLLVCKVG